MEEMGINLSEDDRMKYANLWWPHGENGQEQNEMVNIGDILQFLAIDYLYQTFGIGQKDIYKLRMDEVATYDGEESLVLPLNWCIFDPFYMDGDRLNISPKIKPVFLAMTLGSRHKDSYFNEYNIQYLKKYEPIGCRDEVTMKVLREYGIDAYLNGCLTATLPRRSKTPATGKTYIVDAPLELEEYIPADILANAKCMTQQYYCSKETFSREELVEEIKAQYREYEKEATLVITSRLHVASPCMAMGIPVIFVKRRIDERFAWLDKLLPLYDYSQFDDINWQPSSIEYEEVKKKIQKNAYNRIEETKRKYEDANSISNYWEDRKKIQYADFRKVLQYDFEGIKEFMQRYWSKEKNISYSLWGINKGAETLVSYIEQTWPNAKLKNIIDTYRTVELRGKTSIKPEEITVNSEEYILVLAVGASNMAWKKFEELQMPKNRYFIVGDLYITRGSDHKMEK